MPVASRTPRLLWLTEDVASAVERLRTSDYRRFCRAHQNAEQCIRKDVALYTALRVHFVVYNSTILFITFDKVEHLFYVNAFQFGAEGLSEDDTSMLRRLLKQPTSTVTVDNSIATNPSDEPKQRVGSLRTGLRTKVQAPIKWMLVGWTKSIEARLLSRPRETIMFDACRKSPFKNPRFSLQAHSNRIISKPEPFSPYSEDITRAPAHHLGRRSKRSSDTMPLLATNLISVTHSSKKIDEKLTTRIVVGLSAQEPETTGIFEQHPSTRTSLVWWLRLYNAGL